MPARRHRHLVSLPHPPHHLRCLTLWGAPSSTLPATTIRGSRTTPHAAIFLRGACVAHMRTDHQPRPRHALHKCHPHHGATHTPLWVHIRNPTSHTTHIIKHSIYASMCGVRNTRNAATCARYMLDMLVAPIWQHQSARVECVVAANRQPTIPNMIPALLSTMHAQCDGGSVNRCRSPCQSQPSRFKPMLVGP